ncbi:sensor histidine kinase [Lutispora sp.]|uniref:sensor histidine kinase n=1 Tax=Lutispora sp. TaxID=2828727 RepID=UPI003568706A
MHIGEVLPLVILGVILQVLIQAYIIKHCWENTHLSLRHKFIYILAITVFNLPAAAVYLINNREKSTERDNDFLDNNIDNNLRQGIFILLVVAFEIFSIRIISDNIGNEHYLLIVSLMAYCLIIMLINNLMVRECHRLLYYMLPTIQLLLAVSVQYLDSTYNAQYISIIVTVAIINKFPMSLAKIYSGAAFFTFLIGNTAKVLKYYSTLGLNDIISYLYVNTLIFLLIVVAFYSLKKQLLTSRNLDMALKRVREQAGQIEKMGALAERIRITAEMHDTVGHTLTSAVMSIEAAEKLFEMDVGETAPKLSLAKEQVRRGLEDIRSMARIARIGGEKGLEHEISNIIEEIRKISDITVNSIVELKTDLLSVQRGILVLAIKECATNALKHGCCSEIDILLQEYKGDVHLTFSDNGEGAEQVVPGSGLSIMKERVQSVGGTLVVDSQKGEGFTVSISVPIGNSQGGV